MPAQLQALLQNNGPLIAGMVLILIVFVILKGTVGRSRYVARGPLLSPPELAFYKRLRRLVEPGAYVLAKVRVADVITVAGMHTGRSRLIALNRIAAKHTDFVIVDAASAKPLCGIELDDASHAKRAARQRDALVNDAYKTANISLIRVPLKDPPTDEALRSVILGATTLQIADRDAPACPKCGSPMIVKQGRGQNRPFWGCSTFPKCRGTQDLA